MIQDWSLKQVKAVAMVQYTMITLTWILITDEIRTYAAQFTSIALWSYFGPYLAPYGLLWYLSYRLFTSKGLTVYLVTQWTLGFLGVSILSRRGWRNWLYGIVGGIVWFMWIDDMMYFIIVAYGRWYSSIAALLYKLPLGAPFYVWTYILHMSVGGLFYDNLVRYTILGLLTVQPLISKMWSLCKCHEHFFF